MGVFSQFQQGATSSVETNSVSSVAYNLEAGTQTVLFRIPNTANSLFLDLNTEVTSGYYSDNTNLSSSYSFISGSVVYYQTGTTTRDDYDPAPPTAYGTFTILPASYAGDINVLSSANSAALGISTSSVSYLLPPNETESSTSYVQPTFAYPYQGGAQVYTCTTEGTYFAVPNETNGFDYFNSFGVNGLLVESTTAEVSIGTSTVQGNFFFDTGTYRNISYITSQVTVPKSQRYETNLIGFSTAQIFPATQIPQGINSSEARRNDMDARELFGFAPNFEVFYSTFMDAPLLGQNIPVLIPHEKTSYGYFSRYPIYTVPFGEYALNSNSMTFYSPTTTIGSGTDSSNTYSTQNSVSYIINSNACNSSTYTTFVSTDRGMTTGTLNVSFGGLLGVTSYTRSNSSSSSTSYFNGMESSTGIYWQYYVDPAGGVFVVPNGTTNSWGFDYAFGGVAFGYGGPAIDQFRSFPKTSQITIGSPNSNAYVVWGTQNLVAEFNGLVGAF
jgi:hypothetical protein